MNVVIAPAALPASTVAKVINPLGTSTVSTFEDAYHRRLAYSSGSFNGSALSIAKGSRLLLCMRNAGLSVWKIKEKRKQTSEGDEMVVDEEHHAQEPNPQDGGWERVLDMDLNVHTNLVASAISDDGKWIAVSDWYETKLFRLERLVSSLSFHSSIVLSAERYSRKTVTSNQNEYEISLPLCRLLLDKLPKLYRLVLRLSFSHPIQPNWSCR